jgi:hypothetical protein
MFFLILSDAYKVPAPWYRNMMGLIVLINFPKDGKTLKFPDDLGVGKNVLIRTGSVLDPDSRHFAKSAQYF